MPQIVESPFAFLGRAGAGIADAKREQREEEREQGRYELQRMALKAELERERRDIHERRESESAAADWTLRTRGQDYTGGSRMAEGAASGFGWGGVLGASIGSALAVPEEKDEFDDYELRKFEEARQIARRMAMIGSPHLPRFLADTEAEREEENRLNKAGKVKALAMRLVQNGTLDDATSGQISELADLDPKAANIAIGKAIAAKSEEDARMATKQEFSAIGEGMIEAAKQYLSPVQLIVLNGLKAAYANSPEYDPERYIHDVWMALKPPSSGNRKSNDQLEADASIATRKAFDGMSLEEYIRSADEIMEGEGAAGRYRDRLELERTSRGLPPIPPSPMPQPARGMRTPVQLETFGPTLRGAMAPGGPGMGGPPRPRKWTDMEPSERKSILLELEEALKGGATPDQIYQMAALAGIDLDSLPARVENRLLRVLR